MRNRNILQIIIIPAGSVTVIVLIAFPSVVKVNFWILHIIVLMSLEIKFINKYKTKEMINSTTRCINKILMTCFRFSILVGLLQKRFREFFGVQNKYWHYKENFWLLLVIIMCILEACKALLKLNIWLL